MVIFLKSSRSFQGFAYRKISVEDCPAMVAEYGGQLSLAKPPGYVAHCAASRSLMLTCAPVMFAVLNQMKHLPGR